MNDFPNRPDHKDLYDLAETSRGLDAASHAWTDANEGFAAEVRKDVDMESLVYHANQRAMRAMGIHTQEQIAANMSDMVRLISIYMEAFIVGVRFNKSRSDTAESVFYQQ